jgi:phosphate transport system protein
MMADPGTIQRALSLLLIARNLERVGDHASNIAEEVIYMVQGRDVRHKSLHKRPGASSKEGDKPGADTPVPMDPRNIRGNNNP